MKNKYIYILCFIFASICSNGQEDVTYLKSHSAQIDNPEILNDSIYNLLSPFQVIMFGEMHGTNESAQFMKGLTNLFTAKGDSVQVGLEIPPGEMTQFNSDHTDSSVYHSDFFVHPSYQSGKESLAWANLIALLNKNPKVKIFFFDVNTGEGKGYERDSLMSAKIKAQIILHPKWKTITMSGNYHNRISDSQTMTSFLKRNISSKICSINMEYSEGTAFANFGKGMQIKSLGSLPNIYNSTFTWERFFAMVLPNSGYDYDGYYYTKTITAAQMAPSK